ncbi:RNA polymerase I-specific transcription initiation factor RRN3-like protein [Cricetulus griseus]|nr:RNA polymerase I-specific transcription initiation factor RRN3-like protein [Cricetulus griseus]
MSCHLFLLDTRSTQNKKTRKKRLQWHQGQRLRVGSSGIMIAADCQGTTWGSSPGSADPNPSALAHLSGIFCYTGVTAVGVAVVSFYML